MHKIILAALGCMVGANPGADAREAPDSRGTFETTQGSLRLPELLDSATLRRRLDAHPDTLLVDLRPAWMHESWHPPGSIRLEPTALVAWLRAQDQPRALVLIDRDGGSACALAGMLQAREEFSRHAIAAARDGCIGWWREIELSRPWRDSAERGVRPDAGVPPQAQPPRPPAERERSAGC